MSASKKAKAKKKLFTIGEANAILPLLRSILRDITTLANELRDQQEQLENAKEGTTSVAHREELKAVEAQFEVGREKMHEYLDELDKLGIELKDPFAGLVDFRCLMDDREVYLCWRLDEPEVNHWHELNAGFAGRQKLMVPV